MVLLFTRVCETADMSRFRDRWRSRWHAHSSGLLFTRFLAYLGLVRNMVPARCMHQQDHTLTILVEIGPLLSFSSNDLSVFTHVHLIAGLCTCLEQNRNQLGHASVIRFSISIVIGAVRHKCPSQPPIRRGLFDQYNSSQPGKK